MHDTKRQRTLSLTIVGLALTLAVLACGSATTSNIRIRDLPQFICATRIPLPTHTQAPTQVQPAIYVPPSGIATLTPLPGFVCSGWTCATLTPLPGMVYSTPAYFLPGPTSTPRPTHTPWPTATPYVLTGRFFLGADVYTGGFESEVSLRLRIEDFRVYPLDADRQVVTWDIEIENTGAVTYATIPGGQVFVAEVSRNGLPLSGQWWASAEAAHAVGITLQPQALDALDVPPGSRHRLTLTAFTPVGQPVRFGWVLDPLADGRDRDLVGGNVAYWASDVVAECATNPDSGLIVPTPSAPAPTHTPTPLPHIPAWCTWCNR